MYSIYWEVSKANGIAAGTLLLETLEQARGFKESFEMLDGVVSRNRQAIIIGPDGVMEGS